MSRRRQKTIWDYRCFFDGAVEPRNPGGHLGSGSLIIDIKTGEKVFESTNYLLGWDGTYKGTKAERGVYTYYVKIVFDDDTNRDMKGSVTLLK